MKLGLDGAVVIVSGGGSGIGGAISQVLAEEGAIPAILARSPLDTDFEAQLRARCPAAIVVEVELTGVRTLGEIDRSILA